MLKILFVDGGNTTAKWCVCSDADYNVECEGALYYGGSIAKLEEWEDVDRVYIADVSNYFVPIVKQLLSPSVKINEVVSSRKILGVTNSYSEPERLGVDRLLSAAEAYNMYSKACCVVDLGTAAKVDIVSIVGMHLGGYIVPGLKLSKSALFGGTAKVRFDDVEVGVDSVAYGEDTASAVNNGCLSMLSAWVNSVAANFYSEFPSGVVIMTGGDAMQLRPFISERHEVVDRMVLSALIRIAKLAEK